MSRSPSLLMHSCAAVLKLAGGPAGLRGPPRAAAGKVFGQGPTPTRLTVPSDTRKLILPVDPTPPYTPMTCPAPLMVCADRIQSPGLSTPAPGAGAGPVPVPITTGVIARSEPMRYGRT